ncbi:MAG: transporter [Nocardioides sp.]|jgi:sugar phosphate permease|uniref:MFS transporter n=1 Tax=Nocardioides sp. TaxID=35761 RepID=UPI00262BDCC2|nr:MFS transporter [Nocardioides sp.]MCW2834726.1 transporter [Nocardioides sp.]
MSPTQLHEIGKRRAWVTWSVALAIYGLAIFNRSSLGVAGLVAAERFEITAAQLSLFTVLQLLVYAALQVPVGVLLDRFGSRRLLFCGLLLMTAGQLGFAFATSFSTAVGARALLGAGDAMTFISVIRLVTAWFLVRQTPFVVQLTGITGQLGAIVAAAPLSLALDRLGWTKAFGLSSTMGLVLMVALLMLVKDSPYRTDTVVHAKLRAVARSVRVVWGNPGTRLGMWSHFSSQFAINSFVLLWGFPFLVRGEGWSGRAASLLLTSMVVWVVISGLVLGALVTRHPYRRSFIVIAIVVTMAASWAAVLAWNGPAPKPLIVVMAFATATGGPASMVGFDLARTFTPSQAAGRANGLINGGGFLGALIVMALIGLVLDLRESGGMSSYDLTDFRWALSVQLLFWAVGIIQILRYRRRAITHLDRHHPGATDELRAGRQWTHPGLPDSGL